MLKVKDVYDYLCELAPLELQMSFDNSGFQLGRIESGVKKVLLALDVTEDVVDEAIEQGADLIVSHHPLIFTPLKNITDEKLLKLIENNIAVISMHTNLDIADGGVNDVLIRALGAEPDSVLDTDGCGRVGVLAEDMDFDDFLSKCKDVLKTDGLRYYDSGRKIRKLAVMGGSGGGELYRAAELGCDVYVTADVKYNQFLDARELGISLIDGDHFCTENLVIPELKDRLQERFTEIVFSVSKKHGQIISFA